MWITLNLNIVSIVWGRYFTQAFPFSPTLHLHSTIFQGDMYFWFHSSYNYQLLWAFQFYIENTFKIFFLIDSTNQWQHELTLDYPTLTVTVTVFIMSFLQHSSVIMGDPVKIVERETTHTASFSRPTVCGSAAFLLHCKAPASWVSLQRYVK